MNISARTLPRNTPATTAAPAQTARPLPAQPTPSTKPVGSAPPFSQPLPTVGSAITCEARPAAAATPAAGSVTFQIDPMKILNSAEQILLKGRECGQETTLKVVTDPFKPEDWGKAFLQSGGTEVGLTSEADRTRYAQQLEQQLPAAGDSASVLQTAIDVLRGTAKKPEIEW